MREKASKQVNMQVSYRKIYRRVDRVKGKINSWKKDKKLWLIKRNCDGKNRVFKIAFNRIKKKIIFIQCFVKEFL